MKIWQALNLTGSKFYIRQKSVIFKCLVLAVYQLWKGISAGPALKYFIYIYRGGRILRLKRWFFDDYFFVSLRTAGAQLAAGG